MKKEKEDFDNIVGKHFEMPTAFLNQLSEMCPEGFILFFCDDRGQPQVRASFQHQITEMGLRSYATKFLKGINMVEDSGIAENISKDNEDSSEDSDE